MHHKNLKPNPKPYTQCMNFREKNMTKIQPKNTYLQVEKLLCE